MYLIYHISVLPQILINLVLDILPEFYIDSTIHFQVLGRTFFSVTENLMASLLDKTIHLYLSLPKRTSGILPHKSLGKAGLKAPGPLKFEGIFLGFSRVRTFLRR